jgi:hypothetical protein
MEKYIPAFIVLCWLAFVVFSIIDVWRYKKLTKGEKIAWTCAIFFTSPAIASGSIAWFFAKYVFYGHKG